MRIEVKDNGHIYIFMSRRNLDTLIAKLDGNPPDSKCTIGCGQIGGSADFFVTAEENDVHYSHPTRLGIPPGFMHPDTEQKLLIEPIGVEDDSSENETGEAGEGAKN